MAFIGAAWAVSFPSPCQTEKFFLILLLYLRIKLWVKMISSQTIRGIAPLFYSIQRQFKLSFFRANLFCSNESYLLIMEMFFSVVIIA